MTLHIARAIAASVPGRTGTNQSVCGADGLKSGAKIATSAPL